MHLSKKYILVALLHVALQDSWHTSVLGGIRGDATEAHTRPTCESLQILRNTSQLRQSVFCQAEITLQNCYQSSEATSIRTFSIANLRSEDCLQLSFMPRKLNVNLKSLSGNEPLRLLHLRHCYLTTAFVQANGQTKVIKSNHVQYIREIW